MKKVCFFISSIAEAGGTGRVCTEIANKLSQLGYDITILSLYGDAPFFELAPGVKVIAGFKKKRHFKLFLPVVVLKLRTKIKQTGAEVLINVDAALFIYSLLSCLGMGIKNIVWEHFNFKASLNARVRVISRRLAAKYSDAIITLTQKDNSYWTSSLVCKPPVITINNPSPFVSTLNTAPERLVLSAGRLTHQKGFDRLLDAWQLLSQRDIGKWELHIVGSGELQQSLAQQINAANLNASVKLIPVTLNMQQHYKQAGIYCMASRFEGFPMVLLEAQSFGIPIVSYNCDTGPSEIINQGNGVLVKDGDTEALADALYALISDDDKRLLMSRRSYENSANYTIDVIIKQWINLLETQV